ncbi:MAG: DNA polymerase III subunit gamma/tau [Bacillota bacterium]|nr:DNA polymerase III subunit gamma/tau [Bacillota bacterium]
MSYMALYRVWRPQTFGEVVGQEQTVAALRNAVREQRLSHAYLFSGPRGTGKTSIAKILAKSVNCQNPKNGEPCNECSSCQDINHGNFMDVIEIDAASNRGIDEIRDLREKVRVLPAQGKKKVYIIDEVHMLTTEAFNALLKTLEEPPESVVFILATTEPQRIPSTILSRCQRYGFKRLTLMQIHARLQDVAEQNQLDITPDAIDLIAQRANGGMRDALGMLDQLQAYKEGAINRGDVLDILGLVDDVFVAQLMEAVLSGDTGTIIEMLSSALHQGKEASQLVRETALYLRDLLLYNTVGEEAELLMAGDQSKGYLKDQSKKVDKTRIMEALSIMMETSDKLRFSEGQRFLLEVGFLEVSGVFAVEAKQKEAPRVKTEAPSGTKVEKTGRNDAREILWKRILAGVKEQKIPTHALLSQGKLLGTRGNTMYIAYTKGYRFHKERMEEKGNRDILSEVIKGIFNREMEIEFMFLDDSQYNDIVVKKAIEYFGEDIVQIKD